VQEPRFRVVITGADFVWGTDIEAACPRVATELAAAEFLTDAKGPVPKGERLTFLRSIVRSDIEVYDRREQITRGRRRTVKPID
jgi:hypothetical protein